MARKPKTQHDAEAAAAAPVPDLPIPDETTVPDRRGRKPKTATPSFELPLAASGGDPAMDDAGTDVPAAGPTKAPGRKGPGRKPKQAAGADRLSVQDGAAGPQGQTPDQPAAEVISDLTEDRAPTAAAVSQVDAGADSDPIQPDLGSGWSADGAGAFVAPKPAAHWDRTTDRVRFDWPAIEQAAAQDGPNQGMAKLLVAARTEGAQSRWPF